MALSAIGLVEDLIVHHSASPLETTFEEIVSWHTDAKPDGRGWAAIAYHHVVLADGTIRKGRELAQRGAHAPPNRGRIGVCLIGDNTVEGRGWTIAQIATLRRYVDACRLLFPGIRVRGHGDAMPGHTLCPGLDIRRILGSSP